MKRLKRHLASERARQHPLFKGWHGLRPGVISLRHLGRLPEIEILTVSTFSILVSSLHPPGTRDFAAACLLCHAAAHGHLGGVERLFWRGAIRAERVKRADDVAVALIDVASRRCDRRMHNTTSEAGGRCATGTWAWRATSAASQRRPRHSMRCTPVRARAHAHAGRHVHAAQCLHRHERGFRTDASVGFVAQTWQRPFLHAGPLVVAVLSAHTRTPQP
jgi:hypothetical protein